jgi:hypothetical protein
MAKTAASLSHKTLVLKKRTHKTKDDPSFLKSQSKAKTTKVDKLVTMAFVV